MSNARSRIRSGLATAPGQSPGGTGEADVEGEVLAHLERQSRSGALVLDSDGVVVWASGGCRELFAGDEVEGSRLAEHLVPSTPEPSRDWLPHLGRAEGETRHGLPVELQLTASEAAQGHRIVLLRDTRELLRTKEYLRSSERQRRLGEMCLGVLHELNNLLAVVLGYAELASRAAPREFDVIQRAAEDATQILRRMQRFAFAKPPLGERTGPVDLAELVEDVVAFTRPRWTEASAEAGHVELDQQLERGLFVSGRPFELREVVTNVVLNALDAMPNGGTLRLTCERVGSEVLLVVEDSGRGIEPGVRERLFEPFFSTKGSKGSGLGLSIVASLVGGHHGSITVESKPDLGTRFELRFPLLDPSSVALTRRGVVRARAVRPGRVLVVEDEAPLRELMASSLRAAGHTVSDVASAEEAEALLDQPVEVIVSDLTLPGRSGLELARRARERGVSCPILLATAWGCDGWEEGENPAEINAVLPKPFRMLELCTAVDRLIDLA